MKKTKKKNPSQWAQATCQAHPETPKYLSLISLDMLDILPQPETLGIMPISKSSATQMHVISKSQHQTISQLTK